MATAAYRVGRLLPLSDRDPPGDGGRPGRRSADVLDRYRHSRVQHAGRGGGLDRQVRAPKNAIIPAAILVALVAIGFHDVRVDNKLADEGV
jgi:hypothetical protein